VAVLWQLEGLGLLSVVSPFHELVYASCYISTKPAISGLSMKFNILNDLKNKPEALGVPYAAL
jgi:hypothetical protein